MEAKELMIGDWVMYDEFADKSKNKPCRIARLDKDSGMEQYYPIPLTDKILYKNGFDYFHKNLATLYYGAPFALEMIQWPDENGLALWNICGIIEVRYVHELQHALRLCGIEKEIVL